MLLLERYVTEMEQDLKVDAFNIKEVQLRLPAIKHKWTARLIRHKIEINTLTKDKEKKRKEISAAIIQQSPIKITEFTADKTAESSTALKEMDEKIGEIKMIIELLEKSEKTFSSMTYDIKNMIELQKLEQL